jgi:hypothetical protein
MGFYLLLWPIWQSSPINTSIRKRINGARPSSSNTFAKPSICVSFSSKTNRKEDPRRSHKKGIQAIPLTWAEHIMPACKDLEGQIFTISSCNKGKDGDMIHTSMEKMAIYWYQVWL